MQQAIDLLIDNAMTQAGADATFYHNAEASFDPTTGQATSSETSETVTAILSNYQDSQIDGQAIRANDLRAIINASQFTSGDPVTDDELEDKNGNRYKVISVKKKVIEHGAVSFELQLRQ